MSTGSAASLLRLGRIPLLISASTLAFSAVAELAAKLENPSRHARAKTVDTDRFDLRDALLLMRNQQHVLLLDLRSPREYERLHLRDALPLSYEAILREEVPPDIGKKMRASDAIILFSKAGDMSRLSAAKSHLRQFGNAIYLYPGDFDVLASLNLAFEGKLAGFTRRIQGST